MSRKIRSDSTALKLAAAFAVCMAIQSLLLSVILIFSGVVRQSQDNAYQIFEEKVVNRTDNLENEMNNVWTDFDHHADEISRYFTALRAERADEPEDTEQILNDMAPVVMDAMYYTKTTGAFLILENGGEEDGFHDALYFRNISPGRTEERLANTYLLAGPWSVAEAMKIPTSTDWSFRLGLTEENQAFYNQPIKNMGLASEMKFLGYWSSPFRLTPEDEEVITYSVPLQDKRGNPIGIFGVEITVNYLYKHLPASDLKTDDSYGYMIGIQKGEDGGFEDVITLGNLQKGLLSEVPLKMEPVDSEHHIYNLKNNSAAEIYACMDEMGMYYNNTPFSNEKWFLIGLMDKAALNKYPQRIQGILLYSVFLSIAGGVLVSALLGRWFTRSSRLLELAEVPIGMFEINDRSRSVLMTVQIPFLLGMTKKQERKFCRDKEAFQEFLQSLRACADENNIYRMDTEDGRRWLRITQKKTGVQISGIVEDVTEEFLETKKLRNERDIDGLTGVKNRMAFEKEADYWNQRLNHTDCLAAVMCDLNGLKQVNDFCGHDKGDEYIRFAAESLSILFDGRPVFRTGGDEFALFMENTNAEELEEKKQVLRARMDGFGAANSFAAGTAFGYAFYDSERDREVRETLARADLAMYHDKESIKEKNNRKI